MLFLRRSKKISASLLLCLVLTLVNLSVLQASAQEADEDFDRFVGGAVAFFGGLYMAAESATELNPIGMGIGLSSSAVGFYLMITSEPESSLGSDPTGGTGSMQPPTETDSTGQTMYN